MSSSCSPGWTPDVFVSFGKDDQVSRRFKLPLCEELKQNGIGFRDTQDYGDGAIPQAMIHQARFALVLLSKKYTNSSKCLDELVEILNRRGESEYLSLVVIPIFYRIDLSTDLQIGKKLVKESHGDKKQKWSSALAQVGGIPGYELRADAPEIEESELVTPIFQRLVNEMQSLYSYKVFGPFGGEGELYWHSGEIKGIEAFYTDFIDSITFRVERDTSNTVDPGSSELGRPFKVKLKNDERITRFEGYFNRGGRIASLTFETNKRIQLGTINPLKASGERFFLPLVAEEIIEIFGGKTSENAPPTSIGARVKLPRAEPPEGSHPVGLFGSRKGSKWDHHDEHTDVRRIKVALDSTRHTWVPSIACLNDSSPQPDEEFIIGDPDEYLSSISGSLTSDGITSLTFLTNKKMTKTIGVAKGTHFSSPLTDCKIVGFYGWRDDTHLHGIGAYFKLTQYQNQVTSIRAFGGGGGHAWDDGIHKGVKEIYLSLTGDTRYIKFVYDVDGTNCPEVTHVEGVSPKINEKEKVSLNYPNEYLTSISGYIRDDGSIQALTFYTNERSYTRGYLTGGRYIWSPSTGTHKIVGFHGTWGKTLNSIGAYVEPILPRPSPVRFVPFPDNTAGVFWDDGEHSHVIGYRVTNDKDHKKIESITFMYNDNGSLVEGSQHGGGDPSSEEWVMLKFPEERLTSLSGYSRKDNDDGTIIHNLQLHTTHRRGRDALTYAKREDPDLAGSTEFRIVEISDEGGRRISGFFGRAGTCLNSIGAYVGHY